MKLVLLPLLLLLVDGASLSSPPPGSGAVRVLSVPGGSVRLPCLYHLEDERPLAQLSVQWRDPAKRLLCHYVKHKQFQRCSDGYQLSYRPANITLTIQRLREQDFGLHVCSVNKPHQFSDHSVEVARAADLEASAPSAPNTGPKLAGPRWSVVLLHTLGSFVWLETVSVA